MVFPALSPAALSPLSRPPSAAPPGPDPDRSAGRSREFLPADHPLACGRTTDAPGSCTRNNSLLGCLLLDRLLPSPPSRGRGAPPRPRRRRASGVAWGLHLVGLMPVVAWLWWDRIPRGALPDRGLCLAVGADDPTLLEHQARRRRRRRER